jgi:uncharacterized membrane protein
MAKCVVCGKDIVGWEAKLGGTCDGCYTSQLKQKNEPESLLAGPQTATQEVPITATPAATAFTLIAWVVVGLALICTVIAALVLASDDQGFRAVILLISGCFGAVLLGLLAEISANLAKLVNKSR